MTNLDAAQEALAQAFGEVEGLFPQVDDTKINFKPTEKWSFGKRWYT